MTFPARVSIVEVGPRDGLQNEPTPVAAVDKIAFVNRLADAGLTRIEITAFVSPRWVPQMADAAEVCAGITRRSGVSYSALVPNLTGLTRAREAGIEEVAVFPAASETFSQRNLNQPVAAAMSNAREVCAAALAAGLRVRAYLSTAFGCPFEGDVPAARVVELTRQLLDFGAYEVSVSDTIGVAHPRQVTQLLEALAPAVSFDKVALHFHDTRGTALVNVYAALQAGVATFDASAGGLGGCPYAPGATGNLATEDLVFMLDGLGIATGARLDGIIEASRAIEPSVGHPLSSRMYRAAYASHHSRS